MAVLPTRQASAIWSRATPAWSASRPARSFNASRTTRASSRAPSGLGPPGGGEADDLVAAHIRGEPPSCAPRQRWQCPNGGWFGEQLAQSMRCFQRIDDAFEIRTLII